MHIFNPKQYVELFHLLFLAQLSRKLDKDLYVLKGGCNMRFYFNSIRYSEDIDIDIQIIAQETLRNKVNNILNSKPFNQILQSRKINIVNFSTPKQTETTQRWKVALEIPSSSVAIPTKIEFSRRAVDKDFLYEPINSLVLREYQLPSIMANHYSINKMYQQKINALILRNQTQARDIFDIYHLLGLGVESKSVDIQIKEQKNIAQINAMSIDFEDFKGQVLAYLAEDYRQQYNSKVVWENIVNTVVAALDQL